MNGLELARELRKLRPKLGVLPVSGGTSGVLAARGILDGQVEFLPSPFLAETLGRRVRAVLQGKPVPHARAEPRLRLPGRDL